MITSNERPSSRDPDILKATAQVLLGQLGTEFNPDDEDLVAQITSALESCRPIFDGYQICSHLERSYHWQPDADMVDVFECASGEIGTAVREKVKEWVRQNGIQPKKVVGDQVQVSIRAKPYDGEIVRVDESTAENLVMVPSLGHVRNGPGEHGTYIRYETLHELATPPEEFKLFG